MIGRRRVPAPPERTRPLRGAHGGATLAAPRPPSAPRSDGGTRWAGGVRTSLAVTRDEWLPSRTFRGASFDPERLAALRRERALSVSVCLPARDVEGTVGEIVGAVRGSWAGPGGLIDEVLVVDGSSTDRTAARAREAGAVVIDQDDLVPEIGPALGKGDALWRSLAAARGDLVLWLDADVEDFDPAFVPGMLGRS